MKQETKERLRYYSKIGQYIVMSLCWLLALIGVSAYSVYWLRQNANYKQESEKIEAKPRYVNNTNYGYCYSYKEQHYYDDTLVASSNTNGFTNYFYYNGSLSDYQSTFTYVLSGDFNAQMLGGSYEFVRMELNYTYDAVHNSLSLWQIVTRDINNSSRVFYYHVGTSLTFNPFNFTCSNVRALDNQYLVEVIPNGLLKYYFYEVYNSSNVTTIKINSGVSNATNYLLTFNRMAYSMGVYQNNYNLQIGYKLVIPLDFTSNNELFDAIVIYPQYCYAYINNSGTKVENYGQGYGIDQMPFVTSFICYQYKGESMTYRQTPNATYDGALNEYDSYAGFDGGIVAGQMYIAGYFQVPSGSIVYNYPIFDLSKGMQMNTLYNEISFNEDILNEKLVYSWWHSSPAPFTLPVDNMTYQDALSYFNYNGPIDYVIKVDTNIGLENVFVLIKNAFGGLTGLLAIQILPGLTLGLLVFMPFMVGLIIVIIRLVKK